MADTYTFDNTSTTTATKVKLLVGETGTSSTARVFSDEEIDLFVDLESNVYMAAAMALRSIWADAIKRSKFWEIKGDIRIDNRDQAKYFKDLIASLEERAMSGAMAIEEWRLDISEITGSNATDYQDTET